MHTGRRGLVFVARGSDRDLHFLNFAFAELRRVSCFLPVEIWTFADDVSKQRITDLHALGIENQTVTVRFADDERLFAPVRKDNGDHEGYHVKFAAAVNSGFEEIIMMDSDVMALRNPEELFATEEYQETGAVFWPDYWKTSARNPAWKWTNTACKDEWEQESGILVIQKRRSWRPLLLAWYLNRSLAIRQWHSFLFGDKDLFRFAWHATRTPFHMVRHHVAPAGHLRVDRNSTNEYFCGVAMLQHSVDGSPFFLHNNLVKYMDPSEFNSTRPPVVVKRQYKRDVALGKGSAKVIGMRYHARYFWADGRYGCVDFDDPEGEMELVPVSGAEVVERIAREFMDKMPKL
ncbi:hypothetical protein HDU96_008197 [Phlyctochytrium bullatum]|nr:hypothetical protein HDU96_008197 [Phlyctochytrium bullatum]